MSKSEQQAGVGCGGCFLVVLVLGVVVAAGMALAALVDPFSWMPPLGDVFADCPPAPEVDGSCDLADRYPGFWAHVIANVAYSLTALVLLGALADAVGKLRVLRSARFESVSAVERYRAARQRLAWIAGGTGLVAALPIVVALA